MQQISPAIYERIQILLKGNSAVALEYLQHGDAKDVDLNDTRHLYNGWCAPIIISALQWSYDIAIYLLKQRNVQVDYATENTNATPSLEFILENLYSPYRSGIDPNKQNKILQLISSKTSSPNFLDVLEKTLQKHPDNRYLQDTVRKERDNRLCSANLAQRQANPSPADSNATQPLSTGKSTSSPVEFELSYEKYVPKISRGDHIKVGRRQGIVIDFDASNVRICYYATINGEFEEQWEDTSLKSKKFKIINEIPHPYGEKGKLLIDPDTNAQYFFFENHRLSEVIEMPEYSRKRPEPNKDKHIIIDESEAKEWHLVPPLQLISKVLNEAKNFNWRDLKACCKEEEEAEIDLLGMILQKHKDGQTKGTEETKGRNTQRSFPTRTSPPLEATGKKKTLPKKINEYLSTLSSIQSQQVRPPRQAQNDLKKIDIPISPTHANKKQRPLLFRDNEQQTSAPTNSSRSADKEIRSLGRTIDYSLRALAAMGREQARLGYLKNDHIASMDKHFQIIISSQRRLCEILEIAPLTIFLNMGQKTLDQLPEDFIFNLTDAYQAFIFWQGVDIATMADSPKWESLIPRIHRLLDINLTADLEPSNEIKDLGEKINDSFIALDEICNKQARAPSSESDDFGDMHKHLQKIINSHKRLCEKLEVAMSTSFLGMGQNNLDQLPNDFILNLQLAYQATIFWQRKDIASRAAFPSWNESFASLKEILNPYLGNYEPKYKSLPKLCA